MHVRLPSQITRLLDGQNSMLYGNANHFAQEEVEYTFPALLKEMVKHHELVVLSSKTFSWNAATSFRDFPFIANHASSNLPQEFSSVMILKRVRQDLQICLKKPKSGGL